MQFPVGEAHWRVRFDGTSTKLSILLPVSVLGLDTKTTTSLGAETWDYPAAQNYQNVPLCAKYEEVIQSAGLISFHTMHI